MTAIHSANMASYTSYIPKVTASDQSTPAAVVKSEDAPFETEE